ncbi:MAG: hypothetical protein ACXW5U_15795 [Thermoanaerobaculia bacterium]
MIRITGVFLINAKAISRNPGLRALYEVEPSARIGNLLIYRGTYHLPALRAAPLRKAAVRLLRSDPPDYDAAEPYLLRLLPLAPNAADSYIHLGNIAVHRRSTPDALKFYSLGLGKTRDEATKLKLQKQIALVRGGSPASLMPVRVPEDE